MTDGASEAGDARDATLRVDARGVSDARRTVFEGGQDARTDASILGDARADSGVGDAANPPEAGQCGPDGAALPCGSNSDCCGTEVCGAFRGDPTASFCAAPFPSGGSLGTPCTGAFAANPTCVNGLCPSTTRTCSAVCSGDADCAVQAADHICSGFQVNGTPTGLCVQACSGDPACGSGQICVLRNNASEDRLDTYCRVAPPSGSAPGTACTSGSTCDHGLCALRGAEQFCTTPCESAADCPTPVPECVDFTFSTPVSGQTVQVGLCAPAS